LEDTTVADLAQQQEFSRLFERTKRSLLAQAYLLTSDRQESQDLVQEAFLRAWRDWEHVTNLESPEGWLRRVLSVGRSRKLAVRRSHDLCLLFDSSSPAPSVAQLDLVRALRSLPSKQRQALVLTAFVGLTTAEVAQEMQASEGTVRVWLSRARASLAVSLGVGTVPAARGSDADAGR
jgi:RNA polymerase sigma-70 factor (ECF subfamily)